VLMSTDFPYALILRFLLVAAAFLLPGYGWVAWLHRRDALGQPMRWALGFAWSLAFFGLLGWPFLWFQLSFASFLSVLYFGWAIFALVAAVAYARSRSGDRHPKPSPTLNAEPIGAARKSPEDRADDRTPSSISEQPPAGEQDTSGARSGWGSRKGRLILVAYLGVILLEGYAWVTDPLERRGILYSFPLLLLLGSYAAWRLSRYCGSWLDFNAADAATPPKLWSALALLAILLQAASAVAYSRPDWDDCIFLAAMLDYEQGDVLNDQEPTHREGFAVNPVEQTLCWELSGAVMCRLTGATPMILFHTLWPGLLVLLAYGAYSGLFAEFLPRRWVPMALLGLSAVHLWGISSHNTPSNFLLPRVWQAKSILIHVGVPLLVVSLARFARQPSWRWWLTLLACITFSVAISLSAVFMDVILVMCLAPVLVAAAAWSAPSALPPEPGAGTSLLTWAGRRHWYPLIAIGLATAPLLLIGFFFRGNVRVQNVARVVPDDLRTWKLALEGYTSRGCAEVIWLLSLPLLAVLLRDYWRRTYLVVFPVVLGLTFANPLLYDFVAGHLTSYLTYCRMWWLFPVGPGLAALFALSIRALAGGGRGRIGEALAMITAIVGLLVTFGLPDLYVWSTRNNFLGALGKPELAANLEKIPADLAPLVRLLAAKPDIRQSRILCTEQVASFLTPYSRDFRFVQTRAECTAYELYSLGRGTEGLERFAMTRVLRGERLPKDLSQVIYSELTCVFGAEQFEQIFEPCFRNKECPSFRELCNQFHVRYVVTSPEDQGDALLEEAGFRVEQRSGKCALWSRPEIR
jgi:Family of unknown function (DUF6077)